ncbi:AhpC/TSA antioxidant enzyme-domain-containing protein [Xylariaceae sp. FL0016]|nr:AhpC/TSA antioxidant enzyme-domain-containing protein [Xylariaceae sp. FL0016]
MATSSDIPDGEKPQPSAVQKDDVALNAKISPNDEDKVHPTEVPATSDPLASHVPQKAIDVAEPHKETAAASPTTGTTPNTSNPAAKTDEPAPVAATDDVNPPDFQGEVQTDNRLPTEKTLQTVENYTVLDHDGKSHTFKSLYAGRNVARRVLIIFIRHFFCGNCQEYLRTLSASITPDNLLQLPVSTFIAVVGCGSHELINAYIKETGCPFPVYADPTRRLYSELGMVRTLAMGARPAYLQDKSIAHTVMSGIVQGLRQVKSGLVMKMGDQRQVGGEFLFEPASLTLDTPISTPQDEDKRLDTAIEDDKANSIASTKVEEKRVTWCHRMRTTRDHAEVPELMEVLGLEGDGTPIRDGKRWAKALRQRKGTGLSMASQMGRMSIDAKGANGSKA